MGYKNQQYKKAHPEKLESQLELEVAQEVPQKPAMVHDYFTDERVAFNRECSNNDELCGFIYQLGATTEAEIIGVVAGYLKCDLENAFTPKDMTKLYVQFTAALKQMQVQKAGSELLGASADVVIVDDVEASDE